MVISRKGVGLIGSSSGKQVNFDPYTKANLGWIVATNFQSKRMKSLKRSTGEYLHDREAGKYFLNKTQNALTTREAVINWTALKLSTSVQQKTPLRERERTPKW